MAAPTNSLVAAGFIIFRRLEHNIQYLLLQTSYGEHHWTPPKGHVDPGESEFQTALRETEEEAGFKQDHMRIIENFQKVLNYKVRGRPKKVVYWLSELQDPTMEVKLSDEHQDYKWLNYEDAVKFAQFTDMQKTFTEVHQFILQSNTK